MYIRDKQELLASVFRRGKQLLLFEINWRLEGEVALAEVYDKVSDITEGGFQKNIIKPLF